jgi:hypothetical protein
MLERHGIDVDLGEWKRHSWFHRLERAIADILHTIPDESSFVLVDGSAWDADEAFGRRIVRPFLEHQGADWGPPGDCDAAIAELASIRSAGFDFLAIGWPSFWWFDEYPMLFDHLDHVAARVVKNSDVVIYQLQRTPVPNRSVPVNN